MCQWIRWIGFVAVGFYLKFSKGFNSTGENWEHFAPNATVNELDFVAHYLGELVENHFQISKNNFWILYKGDEWKDERKYKDLVNILMKRVSHIPKQMGKVKVLGKWDHLDYRLWFGDSKDNIEYFYNDVLYNSTFTQNIYKILVLLPKGKSFHETIPMDEMESIFKYQLKFFILNVVIVLPQRNGTLSFYTFNPFRTSSCKCTTPYLITNSKTSLHMSDLFPKKTFNLQGCTLAIHSTNLLPFANFFYNKDMEVVAEGFEGNILNILAERLNFKMHLAEKAYEGKSHVYDNGSTTGVFYSLQQLNADVAVGELTLTPKRRFLFPSTLFYYENYIQILVKSRRTFNSFEVLLYPFDRTVWLTVALSFLIHFIIITFFRKKIRKLPKIFRRLIYGMWLLLMLFYRSLYEAHFFTYLTKRPFEAIPKDLLDFKSEGYTILSDEISNKFQFYDTFTEIEDIIRFVSMNPFETFRFLEGTEGNVAAFTKREYLNYFLQVYPEKRQVFYLLPKEIMSEVLCMYFPRFSFLAQPFDYIIGKLLSFGFVTKFSNAINFQRYFSTIEKHKAKPLRMDDFTAVVNFVVLSWSAAFIVFILELLWGSLIRH